MRNFVLYLLCLFVIACNNLDDARLSDRNTFIKQFNGPLGIEATACEIVSDGFIVLGNMTVTRDSVITVVIKTDKQGNRIGENRYFQGGSGNAIKELPGNQGYLIVGERIKINPNATPSDNIDIYSTRMLHISNDLDSLKTIYKKDNSSNLIKTDYRGNSLTITPGTDPKVLILGTVQSSLAESERPYLEILDLDLTTSEWYEDFASIGKSYRNSKSVHYINNNVIWASSIAQEEQNFDFSHVSVAYVAYQSTFGNYSVFGQNEIEQSFSPNDIQPASSNALGYGIVGTRANSNGTGANIFFLRTSAAGTINTETEKYFDAYLTSRGETVSPNTSQVQDYGTAITATHDAGFVLAGHFTTTPDKGNGLNDIVLIKLDFTGEVQWVQTIGGTGSETVSTIRETSDQGLLICGTSVVGGVSTVFLIKTNNKGELTN